jgi:hypothetical protein
MNKHSSPSPATDATNPFEFEYPSYEDAAATAPTFVGSDQRAVVQANPMGHSLGAFDSANPLNDPEYALLRPADLKPSPSGRAASLLDEMGFWEKLTQREKTKFLESRAIAEMKTEFESLERALHAYGEAKLIAQKEFYDAQLVTMSMALRGQVADYAANLMGRLSEMTVREEKRFLEVARKKRQLYAEYGDDLPEIAAHFNQQLLPQAQRFLALLDEWLNYAKDAFQNKIQGL